MSLRMEAEFGFRREASIKIVPGWADRGDVLVLNDSWNKGGREIRVPIRHPGTAAASSTRRRRSPRCKSLVAPGYATYYAYLSHFRCRVRAGRHSRRPRPSSSLRAAAIPGAHRPGMPRAGRADVEAAPQAAEGARSRGARGDQPRDGARSRGGYGRVSRTVSGPTRMTTPAHSMGSVRTSRFDSAGVVNMRTPRAAIATP